MNYGITAQGFVRKTYREILEQRQTRARQLFGEDADLGDESPLGIFVKLIAWDADKLWQLAEDVYYSLQLADAEGVSLDKITDLGLMSRKSAQKALCELTFTGVAGSPVPAGTLVESKQGKIFETIADGVIGPSGSLRIWARAAAAGSGYNLAAGLLNTVKTPVSGVDSVINETGATGGADTETDWELKGRYTAQKFATGSSKDAILSAVLTVESVEDASVMENDTSEPAGGLPPHSLKVAVSGGLDQDVAEAILRKKPAGIETVGSELVYVPGNDGEEKPVRFTRPVMVPVYIEYRVERGSGWDSSYVKEIKNKCVEYVGGYDGDGVKRKGLGLGSRILQWKLLSAVGDIQGVERLEAVFGASPTALGIESMSFGADQMPVTGYDMVEVVYV